MYHPSSASPRHCYIARQTLFALTCRLKEPSSGRGAVETVPSNSLTVLTPAMARNEGLAHAVPVVIISGALLILHGLLPYAPV